METKECIICGTIITKPVVESKKRWSARKFCGSGCKAASQKGTPFYSPIGNTFRRGKTHSEEAKVKMSEAHTGKKRGKMSDEQRQKISQSQKGEKAPWFGKKMSEEVRDKMSLAKKGKFLAEENPNWKGGETPLYHTIRHSSKYREWRQGVFERDSFRCRECDNGGKIQAHHVHSFVRIIKKYDIKTFEQAMECGKLWDLKNGKTMCVDCHKDHHKINGK